MNTLSLIQQNYIEAIYHLCNIHGHAHTKAIAEELNIRMASATEVIQTLSLAGYVNYSKRQAITLTDTGTKLAIELERRHGILAAFFKEIGCSVDVAEKTACKVEHHIDSETALLIEKYMK